MTYQALYTLLLSLDYTALRIKGGPYNFYFSKPGSSVRMLKGVNNDLPYRADNEAFSSIDELAAYLT